ncbi:MAG: hypothetical protein V4717_08320 [Bacteroidota bacterium]
MKIKTQVIFLACFIVLLISACLKDTAYRTYTYKLYRPVYQTSDAVRANIKNDAPRPITSSGKLYVLGNYIFLSEQGKGIHIINNSNPANPLNEAYINIPGCEDMAATGNTLYADCYTDLMVIDISNPKQVTLKQHVPNLFPDRQFVLGFKTDSGRVISEWITKDTTVREKMELGRLFNNMVFMDATGAFNFLSGAAPGTKAAGGKGGSMARFAIQSDHLYTVTTSRLNVLSINTPQKPQWKKTVELGWGIETIYPFKDKLFIGSNTGMLIYNVADPANPQKAGSFGHAQVCDPVIAEDNFAYVTLRSGTTCNGFTNQMDVVDIKNLFQPVLLKTYPLTNPHGLSKDGKWLFVCDGAAGLKIFDAALPGNILLKKTIELPDTYDVICMNGLAIVTAKDGIYQYDYSNINNISLLSKTSITK